MILTHLALLAVTTGSVVWTPKVGAVMIGCNIAAIAIAKATIPDPTKGPQLPAPAFFGGFALPALLAAASFGHLIGAGMILGLARVGLL
ncbi:MAG: photosystem I reaction center subunit PsaK [Cyanobacteria bacterium P01_F01_bin.150]